MKNAEAILDISEPEPGVMRAVCRKSLDKTTAVPLLDTLTAGIRERHTRRLDLDLNQQPVDDIGAHVLREIRQRADQLGCELRMDGLAEDTRLLLEQIHFSRTGDTLLPPPRPKTGWVVRLGEASFKVYDSFRFTMSFVGSVVLAFLHVIRHPRALRLGDTIVVMEKTGVEALPVVGLTSFLLGLIMAFMSSMQLERFGANIYVASLVALAMTSELGPIMTAILVAGRSGSAYAAEIGAMRVSEEIDALYAMGFNPTVFLAVPRVLACTLVVPILSLFSILFAIGGGLVLSVILLGITPGTYMAETLNALSLTEIFWGVGKSVVFAAHIALVGCLRGFQAKGGPVGVGNAATSAVVSGIFLIIMFDSIFAIVRTYWT